LRFVRRALLKRLRLPPSRLTI